MEDAQRLDQVKELFHTIEELIPFNRYLGLQMVPVAVIRTVEGDEGALIQWVSDAVNEMDRREQEIGPRLVTMTGVAP